MSFPLRMTAMALLLAVTSASAQPSGTGVDIGDRGRAILLNDGTTGFSPPTTKGEIAPESFDNGMIGTKTDLGHGLSAHSFTNGVSGTSVDIGGGITIYHFTDPSGDSWPSDEDEFSDEEADDE